ncbi:methyltransferase domain-containing protein [Sphingomonas sp. SRS2]|uniref:methyltransferase domain-containing protein n=1 Tax=Sphingomonas sp. SRS2 TaxID=133190 RepID=UPI0006184E8F|nr:methyltransferase domain-containing protein [Sphingomonas sp. SRS2]KKC25496.1 methyltransferase type 11 [Sphingomonas sp. SRS2]
MIDTPSDRRARIAAAFGRADRYDEAAGAQRIAADALAARIATAPLPPAPRILELGCGTGFLTRALHDAIGPARWTVSDIAPDMVDRARAALDIEADYRVIDGEAVDPALGRFDLIASSLSFQWFADLPRAVAALTARLDTGGLLAFSTMAADGFPEWTAALAAEGLSGGTPAYPDRAALAALAPLGFRADVQLADIPQQQADAATFLRRLKAIGAGTPAEGYRPLSPAALRQAMARFDAGPRIVTWRVAYCLISG